MDLFQYSPKNDFLESECISRCKIAKHESVFMSFVCSFENLLRSVQSYCAAFLAHKTLHVRKFGIKTVINISSCSTYPTVLDFLLSLQDSGGHSSTAPRLFLVLLVLQWRPSFAPGSAGRMLQSTQHLSYTLISCSYTNVNTVE